MKLDIGSGKYPQPGHLTLDWHYPAQIMAHMDEIPLPDDGVDGIFSSHALEHVPQAKVLPTLREWYRILKPGAKLTLRVPDLRWACQHWLNNPTLGWQMCTIFGTQEHEGEFHKSGFTPTILEAYLEEAGFKVGSIKIIWDHAQDTIEAIAHKPER